MLEFIAGACGGLTILGIIADLTHSHGHIRTLSDVAASIFRAWRGG